MKRGVFATFGAIAMVGFTLPAVAQTTSSTSQLLQSKSCKGCDLSNANLSGVDLSGANLNGANLSNADLSNTNLTGTDLTGANLYLVKLGNSTLTNAKLSNSNLTGAKAEQANLSNANLSDATLSYAALNGANLSGADLSRIKGSDVNLNGANLSGTNLTQANLRNADLTGTTFTQANLTNANLSNANLSSANLQDATLTGTNLAGAQLQQASLPSTVITPQTTAADPSKSTSGGAEGADLAPDSTANSTTPPVDGTVQTAQGGAETPSTPTPLELPPVRLFNLETANQQPAGAITFSLGVRNFLNSSGPIQGGIGKQVNTFHMDAGVTKRLQLGVSGNLFSDELTRPINGRGVELKTFTAALEAKYQVFKTDKFAVGVVGSAELLNIRTDTTSFLSGAPLATGFAGKTIFAGSVKAPLTYSVSDQFQLHLTPGVSFFPETFQGAPFYGTIFNIGAGVSWQPLKRLNFFADVHVPLTGGNSIRESNASVFKSVIWSGGLRYLVNPAASLDIYATNAFGSTPATQVLSFIPGGDQVAIAAVLNFTPDLGQNYAEDYRNNPRVKLTARDRQLLLDGLTLPTADTLLPRTLRVRGGAGAGIGGSIATGLTQDVQLEFIADKFDDPSNYNFDISPAKLGAAVKVRFLDQVQGDPFSLSVRGTFEQSIKVRNGVSEGGIIFQYRPIPRLALIFEPKGGVFGDDKRFGTGLGFNLEVWKGVQVIGEYTPILAGQNKTGVWGVGLRYLNDKTGLGVDVYGSNAAGLNSFGTLVGRPDPSIGFNIHWLFGGR